MKQLWQHIIILIIIGLNAFSPLYSSLPVKDLHPDLRIAIQNLQKLDNAANSGHTHFVTALRGSIMSLRAIAGLNCIIVDTTDNHSDSDTSGVVVFVKLPCLLPADSSFQLFNTEQYHPNSYVSGHYISLNFPPDTPPPVSPIS